MMKTKLAIFGVCLLCVGTSFAVPIISSAAGYKAGYAEAAQSAQKAFKAPYQEFLNLGSAPSAQLQLAPASLPAVKETVPKSMVVSPPSSKSKDNTPIMPNFN